MRKKKNLNFSFVTEDSMLSFQNKIIELHVQTDSWIGAITSYCEDHTIDIEDVIPLLSEVLKYNLYEEGIVNRTVKEDSVRLPL